MIKGSLSRLYNLHKRADPTLPLLRPCSINNLSLDDFTFFFYFHCIYRIFMFLYYISIHLLSVPLSFDLYILIILLYTISWFGWINWIELIIYTSTKRPKYFRKYFFANKIIGQRNDLKMHPYWLLKPMFMLTQRW